MAELAAKMRREETLPPAAHGHLAERLADAGGEAHERLATALASLWTDAQAVFTPLAGEATLVEAGILPEPLAALRLTWLARVMAALDGLGLPAPDASVHPSGGRARRGGTG